MSEPVDAVDQDRIDKPTEGFELDEAVVGAVEDALESDDHGEVRTLLEPVHDADVADLLQKLSGEDRLGVVEALRNDFPPDVLAELDEKVRDDVIEALGIAETVNAVRELETDDAVHIISELEDAQQELVLKAIPPADRTLIQEALAFPQDSAGRLMRRELVAVPIFWTVGDTIDHLRATAESDPDTLPQEFFDIFVVDPGHRPVGAVSLSHMLRARRAQAMADIMTTEMKVIEATTDQEDVAFLFRQRDLASAPVVDRGGRLVGVITIDDVVDVIDEEHEDDIMHLGGVSEDDLYSAAVDTSRSRFTWLLVNLGTAILASAVIGLFDGTIEHMVALAVLMPIVASMGGNAGTQTLTVAVRALAMKELTEANARRVVGKEVLVGAINGVLFAVITGAITWAWFGNPGLAMVIGLAMIFNLIVAGLSGALIPLALDRMKIDPAVASAVFLTTVTDVVGFFVFLGLGAWFLL